MKKKTLNTVRREFKLVSKLKLNFKRYIEVAEADLTTIEEYFERVDDIKRMKPRTSVAMEIISKESVLI